MREMHWSYQELMACPPEIYSQIVTAMNMEAKHRETITRRKRNKNG